LEHANLLLFFGLTDSPEPEICIAPNLFLIYKLKINLTQAENGGKPENLFSVYSA
jgi:hypothetical protein